MSYENADRSGRSGDAAHLVAMEFAKVEHLEGVQLDYAVGVACGLAIEWSRDKDELGLTLGELGWYPWSPTKEWSQMGPLMQSNGISILNEDGVIAACSFLEVGPCSRTDNYQRGRNYLEAACRTIVASKLGSVVAIPDEINRITRDKHTDRRIVDIRVNVVRQISLDGPREWAMGDYTKIYSDGSEELATFDEFREGVRNFVFGHNMSKRCMYAKQKETPA